MTTLLELKQIFKNLFDKIDANFSVLATRISSNISGLKLLIEGPSSSDNNSAYYNKLNLKDKNNNVISTLLLKNLFANGHTAGIVAPDDDTTVVNNGYLSVNPNKYYNKTEVDTLVTNAVTSGQVDLSNYYTSNEVDALLSNKQAAGNYATSGSLSDFKTSTVLGHIADYSDITNPMITSNGSNITLKNGCKFGAYTLGQDVTLNVTTTNQTVNTSAGSVGTVYTNTAFAGTTGLYLIMYDISNQGQTVRVGFRHIDGFNSDSAAYSTMGYMGEFYWDGTSISNPTYYPNNDMEYKPRKLLYNAANTNANFKKLYDDLQDKVNTTDLSTVATSGSYNDLTNKPTIPAAQVQANWNETNSSSKAYIKNKPTIPTVPVNVSAFTNDAGYTTNVGTVTKVNNTTPDSNGNVSITIPTVPANVSAFTNDAGYTTNVGTVTKVNNTSPDSSGNVSITIPTVPANVSAFTNDAGYTTSSAVVDLLQTIYPVGAIFIGTTSTCPMSALFGTWTLVSGDKALWTGDGTNANTTISAGLPNLAGGTGANSYNNYVPVSYPFYRTTTKHNVAKDGTNQPYDVYFDASLANSIYGNSTTVQPPAYVVNVWRRTA